MLSLTSYDTLLSLAAGSLILFRASQNCNAMYALCGSVAMGHVVVGLRPVQGTASVSATEKVAFSCTNIYQHIISIYIVTFRIFHPQSHRTAASRNSGTWSTILYSMPRERPDEVVMLL